MRQFSFDECYRILGLPGSATADEIRSAFRRLARENHPDVNRAEGAHRRFAEIAHAYRILREKLRYRPPDAEWGECPRCGQFADLLPTLDDRRSCADCLLGTTQRRRFLPLPITVIVKHLAVFACYVLSIVFLFVYGSSGDMSHAFLSLLCVGIGLAVLAAQVFWLSRGESASSYLHGKNARRVWDNQRQPTPVPFPSSAEDRHTRGTRQRIEPVLFGMAAIVAVVLVLAATFLVFSSLDEHAPSSTVVAPIEVLGPDFGDW